MTLLGIVISLIVTFEGKLKPMVQTQGHLIPHLMKHDSFQQIYDSGLMVNLARGGSTNKDVELWVQTK